VEDLLLLARLDEGRPLQSAEVDLAALLAESVWDARAAGTDHEWQLQLSLDAPAMVVGDEARLHQVLANLLANARMHTPVGTTVTASVEATAAHTVVIGYATTAPHPPALLPRSSNASPGPTPPRPGRRQGGAAPASAWPSRRRSREHTAAAST